MSRRITFDPPITAHRGVSRMAPENTLAAFRKAKELGIHWVEFDVMLSSDDIAVVIHDETLDRTTGFNGNVGDFPYRFLKTLDAGSWFDPSFSKERIPTLADVINLLNELKLSANIEIKAQPGKEDQTVKRVMDVIEAHWGNISMPPLISSFSISILEKIRAHSARSLIGFLMHEWRKDWEDVCDDLQAIAVDVNHKILDPEKVKSIKATQRALLAYTVNDVGLANKLYSWGVDAVFSDTPNELLKGAIKPGLG